MAGTYSLELQIFGVYTTDIPTLEIWEDGVLDSSHPALLTGSTISVTINYGGALPTSLEFRFNDGLAEGGRTIEVRSIRINDQYVNTGNYLSIDSLTNGGAAGVVDIATADFLAAPADPTGADFAGATALTAGADYYNRSFDGSNQILDGLAGNDGIVGGAGDDRIDGGAGDDRIIGGAGADFIFGNDDNDTIFGNADNDTIFGGDGNDRLLGGSGADEIHGGADNDIIRGGSGNDTLTGGTGVDNLGGGGGDDIMYGGAGQDFLSGSSGDDTLDGGGDEDTLIGGGGNDFLDGGDANDILGGNQGEDVLNGGDGDDQLFGGSDNDILIGGEDAGNDTLYGEGGDDNLDGGQGSDVLVGGSGADTLTGGDDNDFLHGNGLTTSEIAQILRANPTVTYNYQTNSFYEFVTVTETYSDAKTIAETTFLNGVAGHIANITSQTEHDYLATLMGASPFAWIGGSDNLEEGTWLWEGGVEAGVNFWQGDFSGSAPSSHFTLWWGGTEPNDGGGGEDFLEIRPITGGVWNDTGGPADPFTPIDYFIEWNAGLMNDDNAIDIIDGGAGNDYIYGYGGDDVLSGGDDNDILIGGAGADTINGDAGNDSLYGGDGADIIDAGTGDDLIGLQNGDFAAGESIDGGADTDEIILTNATTVDFTTGTITDVENLTGSGGDDDVTYTIQQALDFTTIDLGNGTDNSRVQINGTVDATILGTPTVTNTENGFLTGSTGDDDLTISGAQLDALVFGTGTIDFDTGTADILRLTSTSADLNALGATDGSILGLERINASTAGASVTIDLNGQTEDFAITGSGSGDILTTGSGDDTINSAGGNDTITSGAGIDTINSGAGADTINLANGDFAAGESIDGDTGTDELILTNATTVDFTTGTLSGLETLTGSTGNDDVTLSISQFFSFTDIDYGTGTNAQTIDASGTNDVTALTAPTVTNVSSSSILFSAGVDDLTISGEQLDAFTTGLTTLNTLGSSDILNITSTSTALNAYGANDANLINLEVISASGAGSDVVISVSGQNEGFTLTGSVNNDTLTGGAAIDEINGGDGNDILTGLDGGDTINGGDGNDIILGGDDNDILNGGDGNDTIYGATIIGESGIETVVQTNSTTWFTVDFSATILNPVVKMSNLTNNDGDPYSIRVRNLSETGFEWQIDEWDYLDGSRTLAEDVSWLAISEGRHTLDNGAVIQAGTTTVTNEAQTTVTFSSAFGTAPVVLSQTITDNDTAAVVTRNRSVTTTGFNVNLLEEEIADGTHATETVGWIAIDEVGTPASGFLVGQTAPTLVSDAVTTINFGGTFANTPVFVHDQQTVNGGDTSWSQADGITTTTARVLIGEEQSGDAETSHGGRESVGYFALNEGLLTAENGGNNTFTGGAGVDTLFGGDGSDTFVFELLNAFIDNDILADFSAGENDILDISDLITSGTVNVGNIANYLNFDDSSGTDTIVEVDSTGGGVHSAIATINGITGLDEVTLFTNGNIIA